MYETKHKCLERGTLESAAKSDVQAQLQPYDFIASELSSICYYIAVISGEIDWKHLSWRALLLFNQGPSSIIEKVEPVFEACIRAQSEALTFTGITQ